MTATLLQIPWRGTVFITFIYVKRARNFEQKKT